MNLIGRPALGRIAALAILALLVVLFCVGPLAAYCGLIADNNDALTTKAALLQRKGEILNLANSLHPQMVGKIIVK